MPTSPPAATLSCACWKLRHGVETSPHVGLSLPAFETQTLVGAADAIVICASASTAASALSDNTDLDTDLVMIIHPLLRPPDWWTCGHFTARHVSSQSGTPLRAPP